MNKLEEFIKYLKGQVSNHSIYVWGAQGQKGDNITEEWIRRKETSTTNANRAIKLWKKQIKKGFQKILRAFDCSGLLMFFLIEKGIYESDMNANSLMYKCNRIGKSQLMRGDWVFRVDGNGRAYHIGVIVDEELHVIEAKGRDDGVVKRTLNASGSSYWNAFGRPDVFKNEILAQKAIVAPKFTFKRLLKKKAIMMRGDDVKQLQTLLKAAGFTPGSIDGVFGKYTLAAVKDFQQAKGLTVDGIAGPKTITTLGGVYEKKK